MVKKAKKAKHKRGYPKKTKKAPVPHVASFHQSTLQQALALHQANRLPQAEALYRKILLVEPNHPEALNFLGILANQVGKSEIAVELLSKAISCRPDYVDAYSNLGVILNDQGKLDKAVTIFRQALKLKPDYAEVHSNLGNALKDQGKLDEAAASFRQALTLKPDYAELHFNLGNVLKDQAKLDEAAASFRQALTLKPDYTEVHFNLGNVLKDQGKLDEAAASFRQAITLKPNYAEVHFNLGNVLKDQGKFDEATESYRQAITIKPDYAIAHFNLGYVLKDQGKFDEAVESYRQAINTKPDYAIAHINLGNILKDQGKFDEAAESYRRAITLKPDHANAHNNLGNVLKDQGKLDEAVESYRRALTLEPDHAMAHSNLLICLNYLPDQPVSLYLDEARHYGRKATAKVNVHFSHRSCATKLKRLRVGLVSGDFRNHPVGYFLENILANLDLTKIDLVAYPTYYEEDELTARIRSRFIAWKPLLDMDDEVAAHMIHDDGVHILLDLAGHTRHNRLPVFAWKPAPIQAAWLGYFASTGIAEMDYLIADPVSVPDSHKEHFTEKVWYLPETRVCFSPPVIDEELPPTPLPALRNKYITFGSFQNLAKINDEVLAVWGRVFQLLPQAKLILRDLLLDSPVTRKQLQRRLARNGIAPERVTFEKQVPRMEYLAAHAFIDIILDTFPFTGGTTTCEALWMGVPTLTLAGNTMIARQGASLLTCAGLTDWVSMDDEDYVAKAVAHATNLEKLAELRAGLRRQVLASPLFDGLRFAQNFEAAMWGMWRRFRTEQ